MHVNQCVSPLSVVLVLLCVYTWFCEISVLNSFLCFLGNLMASNDDVELENENQISSVKNETSPDQIQDRKVEACGKSPCCVIGSDTRHHKVDYVSVEETVQRVVQEVKLVGQIGIYEEEVIIFKKHLAVTIKKL